MYFTYNGYTIYKVYVFTIYTQYIYIYLISCTLPITYTMISWRPHYILEGVYCRLI